VRGNEQVPILDQCGGRAIRSPFLLRGESCGPPKAEQLTGAFDARRLAVLINNIKPRRWKLVLPANLPNCKMPNTKIMANGINIEFGQNVFYGFHEFNMTLCVSFHKTLFFACEESVKWHLSVHD